MQVEKDFKDQKRFFRSGSTLAVNFRKKQLSSLRDVIIKRESEVLGALKKDLGKSPTEAYSTEFYPLLSEIGYQLNHLNGWARSTRVRVPVLFQPARASYSYVPKGCVLVIGPFNYPFLLSLRPLVGAIAAGNCVTLKPSEKTPNVSKVIASLLEECFRKDLVKCVLGDRSCAEELTQLSFDHFFFTGSSSVGRKIYKQAADQFATVTLELGGKSPFVVWSGTNVRSAAKKCVWGKLLNHGQTCVAPDHLLIETKLVNDFVKWFKHYTSKFLDEDYRKSPYYSSCVDIAALDRLESSLRGVEILAGGQIDRDRRRMEPTLVSSIPEKHPLATDEIFGPILPIHPFDHVDELISFCEKNPHPLTSYVFSKNQKIRAFFREQYQSGSVIFYETMIHVALPSLPFGGVAASGIGRYHGRASFEALSNLKTIYDGSEVVDSNLRYSPYKVSLPWLKRLFPFVG